MANHRIPGIICQVRDWYEDLEDGTLARVHSPLPHVVGLHGRQGQAQQQALASGNCAFLNPMHGTSGTVRAPQAAFDRSRAASGTASLSPPQAVASQSWTYGPPSAAMVQNITLDGRTIRLIRPTDADAAGKNLPTVQQLTEALRAVPLNQRVHTTEIALNFRPHPSSTPTRTIAGDAGSGKIDLFPVTQSQSQNDFDNRVMHESGHNYQGHLWNSAQSVQEWRTAASADPGAPSPYARENAGEDFCEFNILYNASRGTPCAANAQRIYPNRWAKRVEYDSKP